MATMFTLNGREVDSLPGIGEKVQLDADTKAALLGYIEKNKNDPAYQAFIADDERERLDGMVAGVETPRSAARKRLDALKAKHGATVRPFEFDGETYHIKELEYHGIVALALSVSRDGYNVLNINDEGGVMAVTKAVLRACVCDGDGEAYFEYSETADDLEEYLKSPAATALISALFQQCCAENPDIFNTAKKA